MKEWSDRHWLKNYTVTPCPDGTFRREETIVGVMSVRHMTLRADARSIRPRGLGGPESLDERINRRAETAHQRVHEMLVRAYERSRGQSCGCGLGLPPPVTYVTIPVMEVSGHDYPR